MLEYNWKEIKEALNNHIPIMPIIFKWPNWYDEVVDSGCVPLTKVKETDYCMNMYGDFSELAEEDLCFKISKDIEFDEEKLKKALSKGRPVITVKINWTWRCIPVHKFKGLYNAEFYCGNYADFAEKPNKNGLYTRECGFEKNIERKFPGSYPEKREEIDNASCITDSDIMTASGMVRAHKIRCGDLAFTNKNRYRPITEVQVRDVTEIELHTIKTKNSKPLNITSDHPLFIDKHWIDAGNINDNDSAIMVNTTKEKEQQKITLYKKSVHKNVRLYNFIVEDDMTYVANGFIAHSPYPNNN